LSLAPEAASAAAARRFVADAIATWGHDGLADSVTLLTSEVVTNAILHAGSDIELVVHRRPDGVRVAVRDESPNQPVKHLFTADGASGRGLALVDALASSWGVDHLQDDGKWVWFEVAG
jgi:anti-sigma regulatory factor (Ser/Thr protein kinase)